MFAEVHPLKTIGLLFGGPVSEQWPQPSGGDKRVLAGIIKLVSVADWQLADRRVEGKDRAT